MKVFLALCTIPAVDVGQHWNCFQRGSCRQYCLRLQGLEGPPLLQTTQQCRGLPMPSSVPPHYLFSFCIGSQPQAVSCVDAHHVHYYVPHVHYYVPHGMCALMTYAVILERWHWYTGNSVLHLQTGPSACIQRRNICACSTAGLTYVRLGCIQSKFPADALCSL